VGDSVTVTKRSATTGIYDCSYNPAGETEGDQFTVEESAVVTGTTTAQATYSQSWGFVVSAVAQDAAAAAITAAGLATPNDVFDQVEDVITNSDIASNTNLGLVENAILAKLPSALVGGRIDASIGSMSNNVITTSSINDGAFTEPKFSTGFFSAIWNVATRTLTSISDSSGITTLLERIPGLIRTKDEDNTSDGVINTDIDTIKQKISGKDNEVKSY
jgi:hypothetical protein